MKIWCVRISIFVFQAEGRAPPINNIIGDACERGKSECNTRWKTSRIGKSAGLSWSIILFVDFYPGERGGGGGKGNIQSPPGECVRPCVRSSIVTYQADLLACVSEASGDSGGDRKWRWRKTRVIRSPREIRHPVRQSRFSRLRSFERLLGIAKY